ncbi:hypothetical protein PR202_ga09220 [Eleusine coracana subsp. coracana]|uniref:Non-green plastid inner envelope membrane protein n=1 Tax=Eleusine coracana subsp. coracana TaxID=191504 RepID=A0AAV5C378_ELECO|nr:hypothetical protein QOZ80_1AG0038070 [Eleusine coracana subsp. coracana]GJM92726.1 hypothetical protein PR202_ga09220 [Eleusine coracana subsp. coracana]
MAASLVHAVAAPGQPAARAFHPLASAPALLRLARSPSSSRRGIEVSLRAVSAGPRGLVGRGALRGRRVVAALAAEEEGSHVAGDKDTVNVEIQPEEAQEAWKVMLEQFKAEALRMQALSLQAYEVYSKRTREVLLEASEKLKIQAEKAQKDLSVIAAEVGQEGQEYLKLAAQKSPDSVKDITDTFSALSSLSFPSQYKDYHVGIPFGTFLSVGGFLDFMLTGRTSALRFGIILGLALLAVSISSLRSQRDSGRQPRLLLKGQAAIATVIFFRELSLLLQIGWFPKIFMVLLSGTATAFYFYRIATGNTPKISEQ